MRLAKRGWLRQLQPVRTICLPEVHCGISCEEKWHYTGNYGFYPHRNIAEEAAERRPFQLSVLGPLETKARRISPFINALGSDLVLMFSLCRTKVYRVQCDIEDQL